MTPAANTLAQLQISSGTFEESRAAGNTDNGEMKV
jgi:hypothetical protein